MAQPVVTHRFGPDVWATVSSTGEHVKVELWSEIAKAYRVHSAGNGVQFFAEAELMEVPPYPDEDFSRHWSRCRRPACGAPLTADRAICPECQTKICSCGYCSCSPAAARRQKAKAASKRKPKKATAAEAPPAVEPA